MLLNQRSKQYFKLSKSSLNMKNVQHLDPKHTHAHTKQVQPILHFKNKSRQFSEHTLTHVFLIMAKSYCTCTCIKSRKEFACCVKTSQNCISVSCYDDLRYEKINLTHNNHNCLMGTITFKVHPITPTSPRRHAFNHIQSILILFSFFSLHIFLLLSKSCMGI